MKGAELRTICRSGAQLQLYSAVNRAVTEGWTFSAVAHNEVEVEVAHHVEVEAEGHTGGERICFDGVEEVVVMVQYWEGFGIDGSGGAEDGGEVKVGLRDVLAIVVIKYSEDFESGEELKVGVKTQLAGEMHE